MGADLTITKSGKYFRDSYNPSSTWWVIGLSYWEINDTLKKKKLLDEEGNVSLDGVKLIWNEIEKHPFTEDKVLAHISRHRNDLGNLGVHKYTPENIRKWIQYFQKGDKEMRSFWKEAIKLKSSVEFSV